MNKIKLKHIIKLVFPIKLRKILRRVQTRIYIKCIKIRTLSLIPTLKSLESTKKTPQFVVSLTSYGKRLKKSAPFAIITLLDQSIKPDKIILWVAKEDKKNVPKIMDKLTKKGLEIRFCEDIKLYNKLIPSIEAFPDSYIVTADDNIYYPQNWFEQLIIEHQKNPNKIICHKAKRINVDENHNLTPYSQWASFVQPISYFAHLFVSHEKNAPNHQLESIFPLSKSGIMYPPKSLYYDVTKKNLFMKLAADANDFWFWAMAVINREYNCDESPFIVIENNSSKDLQTVNIVRKNDALNCNLDSQINCVLGQYPVLRDVIKKIDRFCYGLLAPCEYKMKLDTTDWIQKQIYENGCYEKPHVLALLSLISEDGIFFDIGTNIGVYSLNFSKKAKVVYAFEATKKTYDHLVETISANKVKNIYSNFNAVHCESGVDIEIRQGNEAQGIINIGNNGMFNEEGIVVNIVKSITIDDFVNSNNIQRIDIIKMDIEGNELNALKGAKKSILRFRPIILCEINPEMNVKAGYTAEELFDFIKYTLNYVPMLFEDKIFLHVNKKYVVKSQNNVFFFPKEKGIIK